MAPMRLERKRVKRKLNPDTFYYYIISRENSRKKRTYVPLRKILDVMDMLEKRRLKERQKESPEKSFKEPMEKSFFPKQMRFILKSAGYSIRGSTLKRGRNFMSKAAASVRFSMLEPECQDAMKSPENLLRLNRGAYSLLKRR
ncbi:MAG: hypothetical protein WCP55_18480, partial [Lentisphaerota bacterium]